MLKEKFSNVVKYNIIEECIFKKYVMELLDDETKESLIRDVLSILKEHFPIGEYQGQVYFTENSILNIEIRELSIDSQIHKMIIDITGPEINGIYNKTENNFYFTF